MVCRAWGVALLAPLAWNCSDDPIPTAAARADAGGDSATVGQDAAPIPSGTAFTIVETGSTRVATSTASPRFGVEVDCDDEADDGRFFGIAPVIDGKRLEIPMYGGPKFPLFSPDFDAGDTRCVKVESDASRLLVRLEAGSYKTLDPSATDEPVPLEVAFSIDGTSPALPERGRNQEAGRLVAKASGIYYLMLTRANTTLRITRGEVVTRTVVTSSPAFTEYYDDVTSVAVDDSIYGKLSIDAVITRLQVQLYDDGSQGFELDLDHAFKDRGQKSVTATISFL